MEECEGGVVPPFYLRNGREWEERRALLPVSDEPLSRQVLAGGIILPPRRRSNADVADAVFEGGACDAQGAFVGGHVRSTNPNVNLSCTRAYDFDPDDLQESDERVVFCGVIYEHFGHQLVDSTSRLWYAPQALRDGRRLAFVEGFSHDGARPSAFFEFVLETLGVPREAVVVVRRPTRFAEVTVPDEALRIRADANAAAADAFRALRDAVRPGTCEKVFLSRGNFKKRDCVNESFLEDFYARRGFCVVHPEELGFREQIAVMAGAREIVSTVGTMSHLATLFSRDDAVLTYFVRARMVVPQQLLLDKLCAKSPFYVDATRSLLPTEHASGAFLFGPTWCLRAYLDDTKTPYEPAELDEAALTDADMVAFLRTYDAAAAQADNQMRLRQFSMPEVLRSLREGLHGDEGPAERGDFSAARPRDRLLGAGDAMASLRSCSYEGMRMQVGLQLKTPPAPEELSLELVSARDGRRAALPLADCRLEGQLLVATADLSGFFRDRLREEPRCERWDVHAAFRGRSFPVLMDEGRKPFIRFTRFFACEGGKLLVPHQNDRAGMSFWFLGRQCNDFSDDFFAVRQNRPLVSDLLYRIIRAGRYDVVGRLYREFSRGRIRCVPLSNDTVFYKGKTYYVASYAYMEACTAHRVLTPEQNAVRWEWSKRLGRLRRLLR